MPNAPTRAPAAAPTSNLPARHQEMPEWLAGPLGEYLNNATFEVLLPSVPVNARLGYGHQVAVSVVQISANPDDKEVFKVGSRKEGGGYIDVYAYSKVGLEKMAEAAGIQVRTERADDRRNPDRCEVVAYAIMRGSNGQPLIRTARKEFYVPAVAEEAWNNRIKNRETAKAKGWEAGKKTDDDLRVDHQAEMSTFRKHLLARTETGAVLRAIRSLLAIKSGLTAQQVARPKVVARVEFNPDTTNDPIAQRFLLEQGARSTLALFGPGPSSPGTVSGAVVIEELPAHPGADPEDRLGGGTVDEEEVAEPEALGTAAAAGLPQAELGLDGSSPNTGSATEPDYLTLVAEGCRNLGLDSMAQAALLRKHQYNFAAVYAELSATANARAEGGRS